MKDSKTKNQRRRTFLYLWILLALLILFVTATYTWFSLSRTPHVNDMGLNINAQNGIELALKYDAPDDEWGQRIDFADLVTEDCPLKPVTWSDARQRFLAVRYGFDGRGYDFAELTDENSANRSDGEGYYVIGTFYARSDAYCDVSLAEAVLLNEGENGAGTYVIGSPVWDSETVSHKNGGNGAENAIRMGLRITPIDEKTGQPDGEYEFFIYEPNCDLHVSETEGYQPTPSIDRKDTLTDADHLILQKHSSWTEAEPVQHNVTIKQLGEFLQNVKLFSIKPGEKVKIDLYVWLEGQDIDCKSMINKAEIQANIQFNAEQGNQSGLDDVPDGQ